VRPFHKKAYFAFPWLTTEKAEITTLLDRIGTDLHHTTLKRAAKEDASSSRGRLADGLGVACGLYGPRVDDLDPATAAVEMDVSINEGKKREIAPLADSLAGMEAVADLTDDDVSGANFLPAEQFHSQTLRIGVASVSAGALSFFMSHEITSSQGFAPRAA
jgi:hypothetical protein